MMQRFSLRLGMAAGCWLAVNAMAAPPDATEWLAKSIKVCARFALSGHLFAPDGRKHGDFAYRASL